MGLSWRGNTRKGGNRSWFNMSASSRGLHGSFSGKPTQNTTVNLGKHGARGTINLGNGFRYTAYRKFKNNKQDVHQKQGQDMFDEMLEHRSFHPIENWAMLIVFAASVYGLYLGGQNAGLGLMGIVAVLVQQGLNQLARIPILGMVFGVLCGLLSTVVCFIALALLLFGMYTFFPVFSTIMMLIGVMLLVGIFNFFGMFFNN